MKSVSIILPFYNAEDFISDTVKSVLGQTFKDFELICINDGSTDNSENILREILKENGIIVSQINSGISATRNRGLLMSEGKYILFLDSDDILTPDFIEKRFVFLEKNTHLGYCCANVYKIDEIGKRINGYFRGISNNSNEEIFLYNTDVITCPSNYLIRKEVLKAHQITFNTRLSSSADRFFLIELSKYCRGGYINEGGELFYRVHPKSMSHNLSHKLISDNLVYLNELKRKGYIPENIKEEFYFKINFILAGSNFKLKNYVRFFLHSIIAFWFKPFSFIKIIIQK